MRRTNKPIYDKIEKVGDKIEYKLDKMDSRLDNVEKELAVYNSELTHHIEGVKQAKKQNDLLKEYVDIESQKLRNDVAPVIKYVNRVNSFWDVTKLIVNISLKLLGAIGIIFGIYAKYKGLI